MEKRAILAFALSAVVLFAYVWVQEKYLAPPTKPSVPTTTAPSQPKSPAAQSTQTPPPGTSTPRGTPATPAPSRPAASAEAAERPRPAQTLTPVDAPLYHAVVSSEGGALTEWTLRYRGDKPLVIPGDLGPEGLLLASRQGGGMERVSMRASAQAITLGSDRREQALVLDGDHDGLVVRETLRFTAEQYGVDAVIRVENRGADPRTVTVALPWMTREKWGDKPERFIGQRPNEVVWLAEGDVHRVATQGEAQTLEADGGWIGFDSVWYLSALIPKTPGFRVALRGEPAPDGKNAPKNLIGGRVTIEVRATPTIAAGQAWEGRVLFYIGPKEYERLQALGLERTLNFGGFPIPRKWGGLPMEWLGVPILLLLKWVYRYVHNYGVAIILLTVVSKALFYPLTVRSMRSMKAMQALQPQINSLRSKLKSDPQRLQRETLELYRQHKVNPMGGCLPMIAQVPIFYALYLALSVSVELQSAPFLCLGRVFGADVWICDLASHDPTYVLPILMGITMFFQQRMTPTMGDPRQAKMMLVMPFVFTFMFLNLPAGLVLYWTVSNVLQIFQQWYMDRGKSRAREVKNASRA